jgi:flagellar protein FlaF
MQNAAHQAYGNVAKQIASPRTLEADLLLKAASRLQSVHDGWADKRTLLDAALLFNRKLWTIFLTSATNKENPLPVELRQNIANLGLFVLKQTMATITDPRPDKLKSLITINRELAAGLLGHRLRPSPAQRGALRFQVTGKYCRMLVRSSSAVVCSVACRLVCNARILAPTSSIGAPSI